MAAQLSNNQLMDQSLGSRYSTWIAEALDEMSENFIITDPCLSGHPIVFASRGFLKMSGYSREEVIGKNGRMFQGPDTDRRSILEIREAIREERALQIKLLNYRKDGMPIWIVFHLSPVFSEDDGSLIHFVAVQVPVSGKYSISRSGFRNLEPADCPKLEICFGSCRREILKDSVRGLNKSLLPDASPVADNRELQCDDSPEYIKLEKKKAAAAIDSILSTLTHYSKLMGKAVCGKRCSSVHPRLTRTTSSLNVSLGRIKQSFVLTDPYLPDMPIVYASDRFLCLTGYSRHEVLGRKCRFLHGPDTDPDTVAQMQENIRSWKTFHVQVLNYRKDGSSFWNCLHVSPARNASGKIAFYVEAHLDESSLSEADGLTPEMRQLGAIGAVKVAVRSLFDAGPSESS
ncbi:unnamed protein product [Victoria cruziana]